MSDNILEVKGLGIDFGGLTAVNNFDLEIGKHDIYGLIGPNGAGKTTVFNMLTKVYKPTRGTILFDGKDTKDMTTIDVNKAGIARTFQNIRLFNELSVEDNVKIGMHNEITYSTLDGILKNKKYYDAKNILMQELYGNYMSKNIRFKINNGGKFFKYQIISIKTIDN